MVALLRLIWGAVAGSLPPMVAALAQAWSIFMAIRAVQAIAKASAIVALILWLPMPPFITAIPGLVAQIPESVVYVMEYARVKEGVIIVLGALVVRFIARLMLRSLD